MAFRTQPPEFPRSATNHKLKAESLVSMMRLVDAQPRLAFNLEVSIGLAADAYFFLVQDSEPTAQAEVRVASHRDLAIWS